MKKKILLMVAFLLGALSLASCNNEAAKTQGGENTPGSHEKTYWDQDGNGLEDWTEKKITLKYASWQHNNPKNETIESAMIKEFTKKYPNITVEMQIIGEDYEWTDNMQAAMESGTLPDVFLVNRLETMLPMGILADITEYWDNDPDTKYIFDSVRDLGLYNNKRYVVPTYFYPQFWMVNLDLLEKYNVTAPSYEWTWDEMEAIAKTCTDTTEHDFGLYGTAQYFYELPKVLDSETYKYAYGFTGNGFLYDTPAYLQAMNKLETADKEGWLINSLSAELCAEYYGDPTADPRYTGHVAIWRQPAYEIKEYLDNLPFDYDIYPAPSGVGMGASDIAGVSKTCKNKQAAYQLLKWMSYSEDGVARRYEIYKSSSNQLFISGNNYPFPIVDYGTDGQGVNKIWDNIPYGKTAKGLVSPYYVEAIKNAATQANKEVIGWDAVDDAIKPYINEILNGEKTFAAVVSNIQKAAEQAFAAARRELEIQ